jgi:PAS domain-containing protein
MKTVESLALAHSWPLFERGQRFDLGCAFACDAIDHGAGGSEEGAMLAAHGIGRWACDLVDSRLAWSKGVYDIFGLPEDAQISRPEALSLYCDLSRATMEQLRAYAIKHARGFTIDSRIIPAQGPARWMRLVAAPVLERHRVVRLHGFKRDVTHEY